MRRTAARTLYAAAITLAVAYNASADPFFITLDLFAGKQAGAGRDISADGETVVGYNVGGADPLWQPFVWDAELGVRLVPTPHGDGSAVAEAISSDGKHVAVRDRSYDGADGSSPAYVWSSTVGIRQIFLGVRRQNIRDDLRPLLMEASAHLGCQFKRLLAGAASGGARWSFA